jgi:glucose/mannose-6-phosphate isomerase
MVDLLDDQDHLNKLDTMGMLNFLNRFPEDCSNARITAEQVLLTKVEDLEFKAIVFCGIGGSAIGGELIHDWLQLDFQIPIIISRGYNIPGFVNKDTLLFAMSYSGNTAETLTMFQEALEANASIIAITSGGQLEKHAIQEEIPMLILPKGMKPRASLPYQFFSLVTTIQRLGLIPNKAVEIQESLRVLKNLREKIKQDIPIQKNPAKKIAYALKDRIPFIFGPKILAGASYRLATQINENSKMPSRSGIYPEIFHNLILGTEAPRKLLEHISALIIIDPQANEEQKLKVKRFMAMIKPRIGSMVELKATGVGKLARILSTIYIGDYIATYLGFLNEVDPSSQHSIDELKKT